MFLHLWLFLSLYFLPPPSLPCLSFTPLLSFLPSPAAAPPPAQQVLPAPLQPPLAAISFRRATSHTSKTTRKSTSAMEPSSKAHKVPLSSFLVSFPTCQLFPDLTSSCCFFLLCVLLFLFDILPPCFLFFLLLVFWCQTSLCLRGR